MASNNVIDGEYLCKHCKIVYQVYGTSRRCDYCNRKLKWFNADKVAMLLSKWESKPSIVSCLPL